MFVIQLGISIDKYVICLMQLFNPVALIVGLITINLILIANFWKIND